MNYHIDLNIEGNNFKMNGTLEDVRNAVDNHNGTNLHIFDSRSDHSDKIIQFDTPNGFHVTGHAVKA